MQRVGARADRKIRRGGDADALVEKLLRRHGDLQEGLHADFPGVDHVGGQIFKLPADRCIFDAAFAVQVNCFIKWKPAGHAMYLVVRLRAEVEQLKEKKALEIKLSGQYFLLLQGNLAAHLHDGSNIRFGIRHIDVVVQIDLETAFTF